MAEHTALETRIWMVETGKSKVFENWHQYAGCTKEDFIDALKWLDEDPISPARGYPKGKIEREVGCEKDGRIVKLIRAYWPDGAFYGLYYYPDGVRWNGNVCINKLDRI